MRLVDATEGKTREASAFRQQALPLPSSWPVPFPSAFRQKALPLPLSWPVPFPSAQAQSLGRSRLLAPLRRHGAAPKLPTAARKEHAEMPDIGAEVARELVPDTHSPVVASVVLGVVDCCRAPQCHAVVALKDRHRRRRAKELLRDGSPFPPFNRSALPLLHEMCS